MSDRSGISQPSFSRILPQVIEAILHILSTRYISFPFTADEQARVKIEFVRSFNFPWVIGAVDCTHIALHSPSVDVHVDVNRKNFHSLNVKICDARMQLLNVARVYPQLKRSTITLCKWIKTLRILLSSVTICPTDVFNSFWVCRIKAVNTRTEDMDTDVDGPSTPVVKHSPSLLVPADLGASRTLSHRREVGFTHSTAIHQTFQNHNR